MIIILLFLFLLAKGAQAEALINEFSIEPNQSVEIINSGNEQIDISDWRIDDSGGASFFTVPTNSIFYPDSCLVFSADFNLNKTSPDTIRLFDSNLNLIDSFTYSESPGAGVSFMRLPDAKDTWTNQTSSFGKMNESGENCLILPTATPTPVPAPTTTEEPTITPSSTFTNIFISEVMVSPESGEKEWVELYNANDFSATLSNWYVDDEENAGASPKSFSIILPPKSYASFDATSSMFNNSGDSIRLLDPQKHSLDSLEYTTSAKGKTLGRISFDDDKLCIQDPTRDAENGTCLEETSPESQVETDIATPTPPETTRPLARPVPVQAQISLPTPADTTGSVLGVLDEQQLTLPIEDNRFGKPLSFLSFSYSLLTILGILLRMKINV